jgi:hypothetical protein
MNNRPVFRSGIYLAAALTAGLLCDFLLPPARAQPGPAPKPATAGETQKELQAAISRLPNQAHEMTEVAYHFANLWFAADKQNWPLADYYLRQTRAFLELAVQAHPVRPISGGATVDLKAILDAVDKSSLAAVGKAIAAKDAAKLKAAYGQTLGACYTCHAACEKPYLRPQIPTAPSASNIDFSPPAPEQ